MSDSSHPVTATFDGLLALRMFASKNQNDVSARFVSYCSANYAHSSSQLFQDLFVVFFLAGKRDGFFVEFGATDGVEMSNTLVLERNFGWNGILAEPAHCWHSALKQNRKAAIDRRCVWSESGLSLDFTETTSAVLSTLSEHRNKDFNAYGRDDAKTYAVDTVSLNDLLQTHKCPRTIDYMSVDTEGSELNILNAFDFTRHDIQIITVEHNYCEPDRSQMKQLLESKGFIRLFSELSRFDDWYLKRSIVGL